ncbi:MAG: hypothetical protein KDK34_11550, partial [Leptospiraceae bacterium]|nr:hypothetical protein [Leptospiraceae bacterium]
LFVIAGDGITELAADAVSGAHKSAPRSVGRSVGLPRKSTASRKKTSTGAPAKSNIGADASVDPEQAKLRKKRSGAKIAGTQTARKTQKKSTNRTAKKPAIRTVKKSAKKTTIGRKTTSTAGRTDRKTGVASGKGVSDDRLTKRTNKKKKNKKASG